ncbi:helix-turn-helix domain-containing protein [Halobacteriovorax sp. JY17]|uniref:helix-turn-helix domain-containing protein n=1 Tax=Halobacteriovorax sp. JY17 TaxID=2014617 RepID=UPI000C59C433|nr:helix-turn-helix domain-containing protein [Halobacteriovorax sp. JY17]PIK14665.1 MAG: transcriptional regulator [Halobacteriovorax sp. JY17]
MKEKSLISTVVATERKKLGYTQEEFSLRCGVSLSFLRSLEQGKPTLRLDKVNEVLNFLGFTLTPTRDTK